MKKLSVEQMENLQGGSCMPGAQLRGAVAAVSLASTFGGPVGLIGLAAFGFALAVYDVFACADKEMRNEEAEVTMAE